jgi:hypothetical protein
MGSTLNIVVLVLAALFLILYLARRRSRLRSDDND